MADIEKGTMNSENRDSVEDILNRQIGRNGAATLVPDHDAILTNVACCRAGAAGATITFSQTFDNRNDQSDDDFTVELEAGEYFDLVTPMEDFTVTDGSALVAFC